MIEDKLSGRLPADSSVISIQILLELLKRPDCPDGLTAELIAQLCGLIPSVVLDLVLFCLFVFFPLCFARDACGVRVILFFF